MCSQRQAWSYPSFGWLQNRIEQNRKHLFTHEKLDTKNTFILQLYIKLKLNINITNTHIFLNFCMFGTTVLCERDGTQKIPEDYTTQAYPVIQMKGIMMQVVQRHPVRKPASASASIIQLGNVHSVASYTLTIYPTHRHPAS